MLLASQLVISPRQTAHVATPRQREATVKVSIGVCPCAVQGRQGVAAKSIIVQCALATAAAAARSAQFFLQ